jgi:hypothetical protein
MATLEATFRAVYDVLVMRFLTNSNAIIKNGSTEVTSSHTK